MKRCCLALCLLALLPSAGAGQGAGSKVAVRRVSMSLSFSGDRVFLFGKVPPDTASVVAVMEGPSAGAVRLMEKGRVALFWMGVHQYSLHNAPGYYWVNVSCPSCNGLAPCKHKADLAAFNRMLAPLHAMIGEEAVETQARLERLTGTLEPGEERRVLDGFWSLQARRGLYGVKENAIRINSDGAFYHAFSIPTQAPEGRYHVTTYFFSRSAVVGMAQNDLFVRKTGLVAWLSRMAERNALGYGIFTIAIAIGAGWLAGALFRRGGGH
jgi:hypothetical protein